MIRYRLICSPGESQTSAAVERRSRGKSASAAAPGRTATTRSKTTKAAKASTGCGYEFESWFQSSAAFDTLVKKGQVACPACGSVRVEKALMAPSVKTTKGKDKAVAAVPAAASEVVAPAVTDAHRLASLAPEQRAFVETLRKMREHVLAHSENVGKKFADEARKMHYEEAEQRSIHGEASLEDAKALVEEGIDIFPIPELPDDRN